MVKARKYVVKRHFDGLPKREDFEIVEYELPPIQNGEILVKAEWVSVDPYLRAYNQRFPAPYDQFSYQVGLVENSKDPRFPVGTRVVSHKGWCDYCVINANVFRSPADIVYKLPDLKGLSNSLGVGAVGLTGVTAYFGFLEICKPKAGETVVVTGAAGAVGSLVGQIAKIKGCRVIGFAGSDDKVNWLEKDLGFDKAFNYKTVDVQKVLKEAAPKGIDCYFDNVGGEISSIIISQMNDFGRVSVCGSISAYNDDVSKLPKAPILQLAIVSKQLKIEGFLAPRWRDRWSEAFVDLSKWIKSGELKSREHVTEGFDNIFDAFIGMLNGENTGKAVVKI
ncbi:prostaglandin reductase 1-like [Maniola jurtina]|uniref:prostaglandin reductase 1-like n=1 Tax=Maniola jurtina TaxID=191418 RepID=UPI001E68CEFB|nr:prostaglandin reductase 1-like [Maniola jurtina]XP_045768624.1 prostaglandin reductase 1-like [Maniola jurtina]XP_045768625.1 prostaglandin reductase 1-like [Maniola jurtina]